jgi:hypothetical protein
MIIKWSDVKRTLGMRNDDTGGYFGETIRQFPQVTTDDFGYILATPGGKKREPAYHVCRHAGCVFTWEMGEQCRHMKLARFLDDYFGRAGVRPERDPNPLLTPRYIV